MKRSFFFTVLCCLVLSLYTAVSFAQKTTIRNRIRDHLYEFDSAGYSNFIRSEQLQNLTTIIYGLFLDDSSQIRPSILTREVPSCYALMNKEIKRLLSDSTIRTIEINRYLNTENLYKVVPSGNLSRTGAGKPRLVLLYSGNLERKFRKFYNKAILFCDTNNCETCIVSLDPVWMKRVSRK